MPNYLTCEANPDFPGPAIDQVVAEVKARYNRNRAITTDVIAEALHADRAVVQRLLEIAAQHGLVLRAYRGGWIPPAK